MPGTVARSIQTVTVNSGSMLSDNIDFTGVGPFGISAPVVTSCQLMLQVGVNSGVYLGRLHDVSSQAPFFWNVGAGSAALIIDRPVQVFAHARIELTNSQVNLVQFQVAKTRAR